MSREFSEQELVRREKALELRNKGIDPFGSRFDVTTNSRKINEMYGGLSKEELDGNQEELKLMIRLINPKYLMPFHGDYRMKFIISYFSAKNSHIAY